MTVASPHGRQALEAALATLRPKLHRYCARMTGSVIDGEDVVQDALVKAWEALSRSAPVAHLEGWVFRIAHHAAVDFLRRKTGQKAVHADEDLDMIADTSDATSNRQIASASLRTFMRLPAGQRSSVILMDVLGYSLEEIGDVTGASLASVKAGLFRGRTRLRELANEPDDAPVPVLSDRERSKLAAYVDRFNAHDFDAVREMLAADVRLELVTRTRLNGKREVEGYFTNYSSVSDWLLAPGAVDGRAAALVRDPRDASSPITFFVLLEWSESGLLHIRDFRYARY